jgi:hypothetical protein
VRALLALLLSATLWYLIYQGRVLPGYLADTAYLGVAFYFGARTSDEEKPPERPRRQPLFLPKGFVRGIIVAGFLGLYAFLWFTDRARLEEPGFETVTAIFDLLVGYVAGVLVSAVVRAGARQARSGTLALFGHLRALLALVGVAFLCLTAITGEDAVVPPIYLTLLHVLVAFYFGSRSVK